MLNTGVACPGGKRGAGLPGKRAGGKRLHALQVRGPLPPGTERHLQADRGARWRGEGDINTAVYPMLLPPVLLVQG